ncbi:hypothetical protein NIASO_20675 [Niabella soli DSM 19437]|uniref:Uncharacterized protein n=1 Tax=Niabella soli DSM 19437 TaxID=929713 RepID=W0F522_9BACT|nr:hypothetical protein NIASO_20675 [Niabella soli DSM 19437]
MSAKTSYETIVAKAIAFMVLFACKPKIPV